MTGSFSYHNSNEKKWWVENGRVGDSGVWQTYQSFFLASEVPNRKQQASCVRLGLVNCHIFFANDLSFADARKVPLK